MVHFVWQSFIILVIMIFILYVCVCVVWYCLFTQIVQWNIYAEKRKEQQNNYMATWQPSVNANGAHEASLIAMVLISNFMLLQYT